MKKINTKLTKLIKYYNLINYKLILSQKSIKRYKEKNPHVQKHKSIELEKLRKGHARVQYLLDHWNEETQVCGKLVMSDQERKQVVRTEGAGSAGCEKTPLNVQQFLGFKSTEDPLYRAEKLMVRAAPLVDPDDFENYLEVVEKYKDKADNSAMMAYTSSWGEANPNGGKEVIDEYLERTKLDVMDSEKYLRQVLTYLKLETLPASKKP